jgi:CubicO group peptidase (beta-lactamase class C family)
MIKHYFAIGFCCTSFALTLNAQELSVPHKVAPKEESVKIKFDAKLSQFLDFVKSLHQRGLLDGEVLISRKGKTLLNLRSEDITSSHEPQFMVGSITKQFFAVGLLKSLYQSSHFEDEALKIADVKRKLHLPISQFLPKESSIWAGSMPAWADKISLHELLTHTSGIPNYTDAEEFYNSQDSNKRWFESYHSPSDIVKLISKKPLLFSPGSQYSYSNTGYVIIAEVIEAITGLSSSEYIQKVLFDPIGLSSTTCPNQGQWDVLRHDPKTSKLAVPFKYDPKGDQKDLYSPAHCEDISVAKGNGSIISTSTDLLKWNQSLHKDKSLLPEELYKLLVKTNRDSYGYGIGIEESDNGIMLGHAGLIDPYNTLLYYIPEYDLSIVVLSHISKDLDKVDDEITKAEMNLANSIPDEIERSETAFKMVLGRYPDKRGFEMLSERVTKLLL